MEINKFFPIEYCRLNRAIQLIGCEKEDIIHWAVIGAIELGIKFDNYTCNLECEIINRFKHEKNDSLEKTIVIERENKALELLGALERTHSLSKHSLFSTFKYDNPPILVHSSGGDCNLQVKGMANGIWKVSRLILQKLENYNEWSMKREMLVHPLQAQLDMSLYIKLRIDTISIDDLWIVRSDLIKIHNHIISGYEMPSINNDQALAEKYSEQERTSKNSKKSIVQQERHAIAREEVLKAAIYCLKNFPVQCEKSNREWAKTIDEKARLFWTSTNEPPLKLDTIERLLGLCCRVPNDV